MKIAYIVSLFPCWSETFIVREISSLQKNGNQVEIISLKPHSETMVQSDAKAMMAQVIYPAGKLSAFFSALFQVVRHPIKFLYFTGLILRHFYNRPDSLVKTLGTYFITLSLLSRIEKLGLEHIHAHWATYPSTAAFIVSHYLNIPYSFTFHAHDIFLEDQMLKAKMDSCAFAVTISDFNINYLAKMLNHDYREKIRIVHCGVDLDAQTFTATGREPQTVFAIGRLDEIKGFKYLIDACKVLVEQGQAFRCVIVGDGPLRTELHAQVAQLGLQDTVEFCGAVPQEKIREFLSQVTMFVLPSVVTRKGNMDGVPVALMEAMASGTPVISTYVSGIPELIKDSENGLLVQPNDGIALAGAIKRLLDDSELRTQLVNNARRTIEEAFCAHKEASKLEGHFQAVASEMTR